MLAELEIADAFHPDIAVILGVRIDAFRVGHHLLLQRLRSPFAIDGPVNISKLCQAVWICSRSYADAARGLYHATWIERYQAKIWGWRMALRAGANSKLVQENSDALAKYIESARGEPKHVFSRPTVERKSVPVIPLYLEELCAAYKFTPAQVLELPFKAATMLRYQLFMKHDCGIKWREAWQETEAQRQEAALVE